SGSGASRPRRPSCPRGARGSRAAPWPAAPPPCPPPRACRTAPARAPAPDGGATTRKRRIRPSTRRRPSPLRSRVDRAAPPCGRRAVPSCVARPLRRALTIRIASDAERSAVCASSADREVLAFTRRGTSTRELGAPVRYFHHLVSSAPRRCFGLPSLL